jgi:hypothetical protein
VIDMFDRLLVVGTAFDWISPVAAIIQDVTNGPSHTFLIPYDCGYSGRDISKLLKRRGVDSWGHMVVNHTIMITVRRGQALWAQQLLDQAGIPTAGGETATTSRGQLPQRRQPRRPRGRSRLWTLLD